MEITTTRHPGFRVVAAKHPQSQAVRLKLVIILSISLIERFRSDLIIGTAKPAIDAMALEAPRYEVDDADVSSRAVEFNPRGEDINAPGRLKRV